MRSFTWLGKEGASIHLWPVSLLRVAFFSPFSPTPTPSPRPLFFSCSCRNRRRSQVNTHCRTVNCNVPEIPMTIWRNSMHEDCPTNMLTEWDLRTTLNGVLKNIYVYSTHYLAFNRKKKSIGQTKTIITLCYIFNFENKQMYHYRIQPVRLMVVRCI